MSVFCAVLNCLINFGVVILTKLLLEEVADQLKDQVQGKGKILRPKFVLIYSLGIVLGNIIMDLSDNWVWTLRTRLANRFMSGIYGLVFDKVEKIGIINPNEHDQGSIVNYLQNDINKFWAAVWGVNASMRSILNCILSISLGIYYFGKHFFVLVIAIAIIGYINSLIFKVWFKYEDLWALATDKRLQSVKNMLNNIKFIKMNAFENIFFKKVSESRAIETGYILICCFAATAFRFCLPMGNTISIVTFLAFYFKNGGHLDVSVSTVLLRIFSLLNDAMIGLPAAITGFGDLMIGATRITTFLRSKEL
jgi:ATP-binding cassette subfamily C (CFTR/MRP) protein 1